MESKHVSKFSKALKGQFNKDGKLTGTGEIKYKNAQNRGGFFRKTEENNDGLLKKTEKCA